MKTRDAGFSTQPTKLNRKFECLVPRIPSGSNGHGPGSHTKTSTSAIRGYRPGIHRLKVIVSTEIYFVQENQLLKLVGGFQCQSVAYLKCE